MIPIRGLFETHLPVANLDRSMEFYGEAIGLERVQLFQERRVAFYWLGGRGQTMLGLWETGSAPQRMSLHVAFKVDVNDLVAAPVRLKSAGLDASPLPLLSGSRFSLIRIPGNALREAPTGARSGPLE